ncbi:2-dehydro-3-deoxygluconokinase [Herbaspirillum sp. Sphag1AN]|uniref:sugar phosphate isomerase/epimerase family protein n=1 Tax=unclassified Herbaspirillum TaxID=2624150 RepID=UPI0017FC56D4|nr:MULTISPECIES: sugar phosphate isomerase [unclassified Herbaspirillum]MBB3210841.1 2-dehydro-3-deoxygluconokinase [Herbaspirillum sp. Sphag1AN]MBB3244471.1 2-dehydro-3-deoxygluconokinase [Herbaspirillum sp. Sphag64]
MKASLTAPIVVTSSSYGAEFVREVGHDHLISIIAAAGASGVEIDRQLLPPSPDLVQLRSLLDEHRLFSVYAAPLVLFQPNGSVARDQLDELMLEAQQLGCRYVKLSLGDFSPLSDMLECSRFVAQAPVPLLIENDRSSHGGKLDAIANFLAVCSGTGVAVGMSFNMGDWHWRGVDPELAARILARHVMYVHCSSVKKNGETLETVAVDEDDSSWQRLLAYFPRGVQRAIAFPLAGHDLEALTRHYVGILKSA